MSRISAIALLLVWGNALAGQLPLSYMNEGDVCRVVGGVNWTCQPADDCPEGSTLPPGGVRPCGHDQVMPLTCCPPPAQKYKRQTSTKANYYCEKYMEELCGGVISKELIVLEYDPPPPLIAAAGGKKAKGKQLPHMALVGFGNDKIWACGGNLISDRFVLSAAHCGSQYTLGPAKWVRLGELDYMSTEDDARPEDFEIVERILHPDYKEPTVYNDIALFKLDRRVTFSPWIRPICLNARSSVPFKKVLAAGWGRTGPANGLSSALMVIQIDLVKKSTCRSLTRLSSKIPDGVSGDSMICAGDMTGVQDTCPGDSGGPLQVAYYNRCLPSLIGVTSFGSICTTPNSPSIYTRVDHFVPWIESIVWPNSTVH